MIVLSQERLKFAASKLAALRATSQSEKAVDLIVQLLADMDLYDMAGDFFAVMQEAELETVLEPEYPCNYCPECGEQLR